MAIKLTNSSKDYKRGEIIRIEFDGTSAAALIQGTPGSSDQLIEALRMAKVRIAKDQREDRAMHLHNVTAPFMALAAMMNRTHLMCWGSNTRYPRPHTVMHALTRIEDGEHQFLCGQQKKSVNWNDDSYVTFEQRADGLIADTDHHDHFGRRGTLCDECVALVDTVDIDVDVLEADQAARGAEHSVTVNERYDEQEASYHALTDFVVTGAAWVSGAS